MMSPAGQNGATRGPRKSAYRMFSLSGRAVLPALQISRPRASRRTIRPPLLMLPSRPIHWSGATVNVPTTLSAPSTSVKLCARISLGAVALSVGDGGGSMGKKGAGVGFWACTDGSVTLREMNPPNSPAASASVRFSFCMMEGLGPRLYPPCTPKEPIKCRNAAPAANRKRRLDANLPEADYFAMR
jgi:hypothetical protein